ncbi:MAG: cellulase family glycosylhydrolase, partial [Muribaculaceae bacterium]|nr:cellulase family glycosylhydrolase [Muribaculaceae bacterium]
MKLNPRPITTLIAAALLLGTSSANARLDGAYYGTNYTVPFAHAYRALGELGVDRHEAIDRDVYHMSRLGLNAFRLHLWDVELSDANGNLLDNEHLELLDYLIAQLEKRNIAVILTAQTNFGNGYPERNSDPNGAYSYRFAKCNVHDDPEAQAAQERYLDALVRHTNRYTGRTIAADNDILAIEINNEPCHSGTHEQITAYVDRMASALRKAGWKKDILYNVSHNLWRTGAFYRAAIDGTTYQWYPTGLVRGSRRQGNFLPVLDSYDIPFDTVPGYAEQPRFIYEYDPADVLDSYLYPAAARTFRKAGFTWVTQFAYDPVDMARFNTEYQTHFLNTAYTPGKAAGMAIAAEVMRRTPMGAAYGKYPVHTVFGA